MNTYLAASSGIGDPRDERTWSRTPKRITDALEALGCQILSIDAGKASKFQRTMFALSNYLTGFGKFDVRRTGLARQRAGLRVQKALKENDCKTVLHFGTYDLPLPGNTTEISQYLFTDFTWNLFCKKYPIADVLK